MRRIRDLYPDYSADVSFLAIDVDPTEDADHIRNYAQQEGFIWPMALQDLDIIQAYRVLSRSTKMGIDRNGLVIYREGFGLESEETWRNFFKDLSAP